MRSLWSRIVRDWQKVEADQGNSRPGALRDQTIAATAWLLLAAGVPGLVAGAACLTYGAFLPFALALIATAAGVSAVALCRRRRHRAAALGIVGTMAAAGTILTIADPAVLDLGIAVALLAPVQAVLLLRGTVVASAAAAAALAASVLGSAGLIAAPVAGHAVAAGASLVVAVAMVVLSATRLGQLSETVEKGRVDGYKHLVEHVLDAVIRFAPDGGMSYVSRSAEKLFGCRRFELAGSGLLDRIHLLDRPVYLTAFADANVGGTPRRVSIRMRRDDMERTVPRYMWVEASLSPVIEGDVGRHEVVVQLRDVTERFDRELELQRARKIAEEASLAKTRFLATIGHELRTPLNAIVGFSEMMTSGVVGELSGPHKEYATLIGQSGHHLIEVVKMLLDMSRLEAGKFELTTEAFAPETLADPCLKMVDAMAREKSIRLMTDIPRALPMIVADERLCRQVLINLLSNAIKFSHERSVVTLGMRRQGQHIAISVSDQGIGMGDEAIRRIGEPFFQAQDGLSRRYEGTGLGLSIVKGLVELHDGSLHASSAPGQGTVMTVLLPINGPETKLMETEAVTPLHRDPVSNHMPKWPDERKRAL